MPANLTSRKIRVFIGSDLQDWSLSTGVLSLARRQLRGGDYLGIEGSLEIQPNLTNPESINPYANPERWRPGQPVLIEVADDSGAYVTHPFGRLFILEEPDFPEPAAGIALSLGCRLTWHDSFEFDDDKTGVTVGTPTNSATVASSLLQANEISAGTISLGTWPYSLSIPDGKGQSSSFIQQASELAWANDARYLYQAIDGTIQAGQFTTAIGSPAITITLGSNDVLYRAIKVERTPPDVFKVVGAGVATSEAENPQISVEEVEGDREQFSVDSGGVFGSVTCVGTGVISRATTVTKWEERTTLGNNDILYRTTIYLEAPRSAVAVDPQKTGGFPCSMINWKQIIKTKIFDLPEDGGKLREEFEVVNQRHFTVSTDPRFLLLNFRTLKLITTTPTYQDDTIVKITRVEQQAEIFLDKDTENPYTLKEVRTDIESWKQVGSNTWRKSSTTKIPKALDNAALGTSPFALTLNSDTTSTSTGQNQPPRAEVWDGGTIDKDVEFAGTATYTVPGGGTGRTRKELVNLRYGFSDAQCEGIAQKLVRLTAGRHRAALIELPISDALLSAGPLFQVDVVETDGTTRHYLADGLVFEHQETQAAAVCTGILLGSTPSGGTPEPLGFLDVVDGADDVVDGSNDVIEV